MSARPIAPEGTGTAPRSGSQGLPVLMYHAIPASGAGTDALAVPLAQFARHVNALTDAGWQMMGLSAALAAHAEAPTRRIVAMTFDDGHADVAGAVELLVTAGGTCTVYVVSRYADAGSSAGFLSWEEITRLHRAGMEIGSHTDSHRILDTASRPEIHRELMDSKRRIEQATGASVTSACYPHGYFDRRVVAATRAAGYANACCVGRRIARDEDPFTIPRLQPRSGMDERGILRLVSCGEPRVRVDAIRLAAPPWRVTRRLAGRFGWTLT